MGSETRSRPSSDRTREAPKAPTRELSPWSARRAMTLGNSGPNRSSRERSRSTSRNRFQEMGRPNASRNSRESTGKSGSVESTYRSARESKSASWGGGRETPETSGKRRAPSDSPEPYRRARDRSSDRRRDRSPERRKQRSTDRRRDSSRENRRNRSTDGRRSRPRDGVRDRSKDRRERHRPSTNGHRNRSRDRDGSRERRRGTSKDRHRNRSSRSRSPSATRKRKLPTSRSPSPAPYRAHHKRRDRSPSPPRHHRRHSRSPTPNKHHKRHKRYSPSPSRSRSPPRRSHTRKPLPPQEQELTIRGLDSSSLPPTQTGGAPKEKEKPNFKPTGLLAKEANRVAGTKISLKYHEPPEARKPPPSAPWRLFIFKGPDTVGTIELGSQSCWLFGRAREVADVWLEHPSCSGQHAVIQFRYIEKVVEEDEFGGRKKVGKVKPYLIDLESSNGTELNGKEVEAGRYVELRDKDVLRFAGSEREYMIMLPPRE